MNTSITTLARDQFPSLVNEIVDPPDTLYLRGSLPPKEHKLLTIVGARNYTKYGQSVCESLIAGLKDQPITIISGLALGIDAIAHQTALSRGLNCLAFPGSGLDPSVLYPRAHTRLADDIVAAGGGLLSEFSPTQKAAKWTFPKRNRLMAGCAHATLIIEATEKSGTLITSRLATDYNRDVLAVPGPITSPTSYGPHMLIRLGATPITRSEDILEALGLEQQPLPDSLPSDLSEAEAHLLELLHEPLSHDELIHRLDCDSSELLQLSTRLELRGLIRSSGGMIERVR